jgi:Protein kinase domain
MSRQLLNPGETLGGYIIEQPLGESRFATVYQAKSADGLQVFLKVVDGKDTAKRALLWSEHQTLTRLDHPGVLRAFEWGEDQGWAYYALEPLKGPTLRFFVLAGRLVYPVSMDLFQQILEAVAYLHDQGITHGDISPGNIFIRHTDGRAVLLDAGIATALSQGNPKGVVSGTLEFISPEHAGAMLGRDGKKDHELTPRDDVYALGVILYFLLTGEWPVPREGDESEDQRRFLKRVCKHTPLHPCEVAPHAPSHLADLALKMLQAQPSLRPETAGVLVNEFIEACAKDDRAMKSPMAMLEVASFMADQQLLAEEMSDLVEEQSEETPVAAEPALEEDSGVARPRWATRRHRARELLATAAVTALITAPLTVLVMGERREVPDESTMLAVRPPGPEEQALMAPDAGVLEPVGALALNGKKMPDKPEANWMPAPKGARDGIDGCVKEAGKPSTVYNGTCWQGGANPDYPKESCPAHLYDPPPHAPADRKDWCYWPIIMNPGRSTEPAE